METKDARRRRKLDLLVQQHGLEAVAVAAQKNPQYLSQILKGVLLPVKRDGTRSPRALGDAAAEAIEDAMHLGRGWFDSAHGLPGSATAREAETRYHMHPWPFERVTPAQWDRLSVSKKAFVESAVFEFLGTEETQQKHTYPGTKSA
jgi:hypothetical protein